MRPPASTTASPTVETAGRVKPSVGLPEGWWPVALTSQLGRHPRAFRLGTRDLALYRDLSGTLRAVDDSCPHRRLPLSMGRITEDGYLQCAYHGWCFDGATGRCARIPNLREGERIPGAIRIDAFSTIENVADVLGFGMRTRRLAPAVGPPTGEEPHDGGTAMFESVLAGGLVLVWTGHEAPDPVPTSAGDSGEPAGMSFSGQTVVRAPYRRAAAAVLHNPGRTLAMGWLLGSGDELMLPTVAHDGPTLCVRRERLRFDMPRPHTFDPILTASVETEIRMVPTTGLSWLRSPECSVVVGLTPVGSYTTIVRWRGRARGPAHLAARLLCPLCAGTGITTRAAERVADDVFSVPDPAVSALQDEWSKVAAAPKEAT